MLLNSRRMSIGGDRAGDVGTPLRVACIPDLPLQRVQAFVGALYAFDPDLHAEVVHLRSAAQVEQLRAGALDLGILYGGDVGGLVTAPLFRGDLLAAFVSVGHRLAGRHAVNADDLRDETLLTFPRPVDPALHAQLMARLHESGFTFRCMRECGGADMRDVLMAVAEDRGIALAPRATLNAVGEVAQIVSRVALEPRLRMPDTLLAWRDDAPDAHVLAAARAAARELHESS
jgi:DNA-binding transcriptional LysR family regulator